MTILTVNKSIPRDVDAVILPGHPPRVRQRAKYIASERREFYACESRILEAVERSAPEYPLDELTFAGQLAKSYGLQQAIKRDSTSLIHHLLDKDPSIIHFQGSYHIDSLPPLSYAIEEGRGSLTLVKLLLARNADINMGDTPGNELVFSETPLFRAAKKGHFAVMHHLLLRGGVVYQGVFSCMEELPEEFEVIAERVRTNLTQAIKELRVVQCLIKGTLHSTRSESFFSLLPKVLRFEVLKFLYIKD